MTTRTPARITGTGLITGQEATVSITALPAGEGIRFVCNGVTIPAHPDYVVDSGRGITLGRDGQVLSIVEHFLSACAMLGRTDLQVEVSGAPEMPLLDGSALPWARFLNQNVPISDNGAMPSPLSLSQPVIYRKGPVSLIALPAETLSISYLVDFPHPDLKNRWFRWRSDEGIDWLEAIAPARTFGMVSELPELQARGLSRGVTPQNTLGLTDDGGYTSPLRMPDEPIRHKILDLIGDLMLCGIPVNRLQAEIMVIWGGHTAHVAFGRQLAAALTS